MDPIPGETDFEIGALIIPMDTDYQDSGMLEAFGLVYELLRNDIFVLWVIEPGKALGGTDFTASATDLSSGAVVTDHDYRGGPWVIRAQDANAARPIVDAWQVSFPDTVVHEASAPFEGFVSRVLAHVPTLALLEDGNEGIARAYLFAAKIPDSTGDLDWSATSPDLLTPQEVAGVSFIDHGDGALFDGAGQPAYCNFASMHWGVFDADNNPEVVAEVRTFLGFHTHLFAHCQSAVAFENHMLHGHFLTPNGFEIGDQPDAFSMSQTDAPPGQIDGAMESVGGSEPSYTLPAGDTYFAADSVILTDATSPAEQGDVWLSGFMDGKCPASQSRCEGAGRVSYLGGHAYTADVPISANPTTQGARLFLNSLFAAPCTSDEP